MRTPMQQAADIRDFAHRVFAGAAKAVDHVTGRIDVATDDHNYEADVHLENGPHDPEICAHASRLPEKQRGDFLEKAVVENDLVHRLIRMVHADARSCVGLHRRKANHLFTSVH